MTTSPSSNEADKAATEDTHVLSRTLWYDTPEDVNDQAHKSELIVRHEWSQFQQVNNQGGRANCQGNWPTFHQMRLSQFLTWRLEMLDSYAEDLDDADATGRNLLTEKYARMMESTEPERYHTELEPHMPKLEPERVKAQEAVIAQQVKWARDFRERFPKLGEAMRVLTTDEDVIGTTSFETYLRGELGTYSNRTFAMYAQMIVDLTNAGINLTEETLRLTVSLGGFSSLEEAEAAQ